MMVTTGNGRRKIVMEDVIEKIGQVQLAHDRSDPEGVSLLRDELKNLVLLGIQAGDFQGLSARTAARLALSVNDLLSN